jgi:hypothetical protein
MNHFLAILHRHKAFFHRAWNLLAILLVLVSNLGAVITPAHAKNVFDASDDSFSAKELKVNRNRLVEDLNSAPRRTGERIDDEDDPIVIMTCIASYSFGQCPEDEVQIGSFSAHWGVNVWGEGDHDADDNAHGSSFRLSAVCVSGGCPATSILYYHIKVKIERIVYYPHSFDDNIEGGLYIHDGTGTIIAGTGSDWKPCGRVNTSGSCDLSIFGSFNWTLAFLNRAIGRFSWE